MAMWLDSNMNGTGGNNADDISVKYQADVADTHTVARDVLAETHSKNYNSGESNKNESSSHRTLAFRGQHYKTLARKYRPKNFHELIGQDPLVRAFSNAVKMGRVAQAFMLTGVRGIGKTTTARIIAKTVNCENIGEGDSATPCGTCKNCLSIAEDRHVDVLEIDAASHTGVDDIREIIESARYTPTVGRYKVFILDEVHMLSKNAFNGLLKILEEPPLHVKFIFATTEIRKVPVTVLSRCLRFTLLRVPSQVLFSHYKNIAGKEGFVVEDSALHMISRCADGSVRDGLSLLDHALSLSEDRRISYDLVMDMLGVADRQQVYDLYEYLCRGDSEIALKSIEALYESGVQPVMLLQDLIDITWFLTRYKIIPSVKSDISVPEIDRLSGEKMVHTLSIPTLTRNWQILMKGLSEVQASENPLMALQMVAVRFMFASQLPTPRALVDAFVKESDGYVKTQDSGGASNVTPPPARKVADDAPSRDHDCTQQDEKTFDDVPLDQQDIPHTTAEEKDSPTDVPVTQPADFSHLVKMLQVPHPTLSVKLENFAHLVHFSPKNLVVRLENFSKKQIFQLHQAIKSEFGDDWVIKCVETGGQDTLAHTRKQQQQQYRKQIEALELVQSVKKHFPDAHIGKIEAPEKKEGERIEDV